MLYENEYKSRETNESRHGFRVPWYICPALLHHVRFRLRVLRVFDVTDMPCASVVAVCAVSASDKMGYAGHTFTVGVKKAVYLLIWDCPSTTVHHIEFDSEDKEYQGKPSGQCTLAQYSTCEGHHILLSERSSTAIYTIVQSVCTIIRDHDIFERTSS